jgi:hypothetical protein
MLNTEPCWAGGGDLIRMIFNAPSIRRQFNSTTVLLDDFTDADERIASHAVHRMLQVVCEDAMGRCWCDRQTQLVRFHGTRRSPSYTRPFSRNPWEHFERWRSDL